MAVNHDFLPIELGDQRVDQAELEARVSIRDLIARYCTEADSGRVDSLADLFTADGTIEFNGQTYTGKSGIVAMFGASAKKVAAAGLSGRLLHTVSASTIDVQGDSARARTYVSVLSTKGLDHWGRYRDEFVFDDGRWSFKRRQILVDGTAAGGFGEALR
jgi:hypothetical protein